MFMPAVYPVNYDLDTRQTQKDGVSYIISYHHFIHAYTPPFRFLLVSVWLGAINKKTASPRKNLLFFCLTSLFANLLARIPSVCHAAQICKPPSQSKKYLRPPLSERIFLLSRKFVRHISTLHCLLRGLGNSPTPKHNTNPTI